MQTAGMIIEYNPLHHGHLYLVRQIREQLGEETAVIGVMSGNFVQRGDFALVRKHARAKAAVESGVDLVLELPLPWAVGSAERFADGGVQALEATGVVTHMAFGSECGDADALEHVAACLLSPDYENALRARLGDGVSYAASRQAAVEELLGSEYAAILESPTTILGVEYCKALLRRGSAIRPVTIRRSGAGYHDVHTKREELPSATSIRALLTQGRRDEALERMPLAMRAAYEAEERCGRAPVFRENCERAILARLRAMSEAEFAALDEGNEGLYRRLYEASRRATSVEEVLETAKTKRYAYTRLRRMVLWAWLGLRPAEFPVELPYLRVLAANGRGREALSRMKKTADLPVLTKSADVRRLSDTAQRLFELEVRATDLYTLAYPDLTAADGGAEWREGPVISQ